jgi:thioesterase domain-containing protein
MAQRLVADGEEVAPLAMFNGPTPAFIRAHGQNNRPPVRTVASIPRLGRHQRLRRLRREPHRVLSFLAWRVGRTARKLRWRLQLRRYRLALALHRPLPESIRDFGFLNISMAAEVAYEPAGPFPGEIVIFRGDGLFYDAETGWGDPDLGWAGLGVDGVTTHAVPGRHRDNRELMAEPHVDVVAEVLRERLGIDLGAAARSGGAR